MASCSAHREGYRDINALNAETGHLVNSENTIETTNDPWVFNDLVKPPPTNPNSQDDNQREIFKVFFSLTLLEIIEILYQKFYLYCSDLIMQTSENLVFSQRDPILRIISFCCMFKNKWIFIDQFAKKRNWAAKHAP